MKKLLVVISVFGILAAACKPAEQVDPNEPQKPSGGDAGVGVTAVSVLPDVLTLSIGKTAQIEATVEPENAENPTVVWKSSDESVVTVSKGLVTAVGDGEAVVTATSVDNPAAKATCAVTVSTVYVKTISFTEKDITIVLDDTYQLEPTISPDDAENAAIGYTVVSGDAVKVAADGLVTAIKVGTATVRASALDGKGAQADVKFTVINEPIYATSFTVSCDSEVQKGKTVTGTITCTPSGTNQKDFQVTSGTTSVATVSSVSGGSFTLKGVKAGTSKITVHYNSKSGVADKSFTLTVHDGAPAIAWSCNWTKDVVGSILDHGMIPGESYNLSAQVTNLNNTSVVYEIVSGTSYATISGSVLTAKAKGTVKVRARSAANPSLTTEEKSIKICSAAERVTLANVTDKTVWTSGNTIYIRQNTAKTTVKFQVQTSGGIESRQCVSAKVSSNLSSYVTPTVNNYPSSYYLTIDFGAKASSSVVKGTLTLSVPGSSVSKTFNLYLCLYGADDVKPGDSMVLVTSGGGSFTISDGYWRGGDIWYQNLKSVPQYGSNAIVAWVGTPGDSDSRLRSISSWAKHKLGVHGYAIAVSDAFSNTSDSKARWAGEYQDHTSGTSFNDGSETGYYIGCPVAPTKTGKYGYDMTMGLVAYNFNRGESHQISVIHHLYRNDRSGTDGNSGYTAYNTTYPFLPEDQSPKSNKTAWYQCYTSGWFLPSAEEWKLCIQTLGQDVLNQYFANISNGTALESSAKYWTPLQSSDTHQALSVYGNGNKGDYLDKKSGRARTRAIMAF